MLENGKTGSDLNPALSQKFYKWLAETEVEPFINGSTGT